ncbi:hypothetical protein BJX99DRAFT_231589 [Aspergillus californicus]
MQCNMYGRTSFLVQKRVRSLGLMKSEGSASSYTLAGGADRGVGTVCARAPRYPLCIRVPPTLALVMRSLPEGVKRSIELHDRANLARVLVALVNYQSSGLAGKEL